MSNVTKSFNAGQFTMTRTVGTTVGTSTLELTDSTGAVIDNASFNDEGIEALWSDFSAEMQTPEFDHRDAQYEGAFFG